jgi:hypothetical protein
MDTYLSSLLTFKLTYFVHEWTLKMFINELLLLSGRHFKASRNIMKFVDVNCIS